MASTAGVSIGVFTAVTVLIVALAALAPGGVVLLIAGMVPSLTAFVVDRDPRMMLSRTVAALNFAATMVYIAILWHGDRSVHAGIAMLRSPVVWMMIYGAAGAGWILHFVAPGFAIGILRYRLAAKRLGYEQAMRDLRVEWGTDIGPPPDAVMTASPQQD